LIITGNGGHYWAVWLLHLLLHLSQSGDRPELVGDKQRDQISELLSAQFDLAAVVIELQTLGLPRFDVQG
jgi:hypothetical protein